MKATTLVIMRALLMGKVDHTIRQSMMSVGITAGPITKDSCQVVYQDKGKITFHVRRQLMHPLVVEIKKKHV
jgi:hypothetical protein